MRSDLPLETGHISPSFFGFGLFPALFVFLVFAASCGNNCKNAPETQTRAAHSVDHLPAHAEQNIDHAAGNTAPSANSEKGASQTSPPPVDATDKATRADSSMTKESLSLKSTVGSKCSASGECPNGLTCVKYYGIAGMNGPAFQTCEVRCSKKSKCPKGLTCRTISDGPGSVCR